MNPKGQEFTAADRREKAVELRTAGLTWRQIAAQLGVSHVQIGRDLKAALAAKYKELQKGADGLIALELERLQLPLIQLASIIKGASLVKPDGKLDNLKHVETFLAAVDRWQRLSESRRKLLGLEAPTKHEIGGPGGEPIRVINMGLDEAERNGKPRTPDGAAR